MDMLISEKKPFTEGVNIDNSGDDVSKVTLLIEILFAIFPARSSPENSIL